MKKATAAKVDKKQKIIQNVLKQMNDDDLIYLYKHNKLDVFCYALSLDLHFLDPIF